MTITDDIVKGLRNATPLYAVAGTADLAAEKLKEVTARIDKLREEAPERIDKLRSTDSKVVQERVTAGAKDAQTKLTETAKDAQSKLNETLADLDFKEQLREIRKLGESVQDFALQGVGRAAEYAVKTRETYDGLAERGKDAVAKWRGETADEVVEIAAAVEPDTKPEAAKPEPAKPQDQNAEAPKPVPGPAKKTTPRKTAAKKTPDNPGE
jgi:phosphoserine phosphatase